MQDLFQLLQLVFFLLQSELKLIGMFLHAADLLLETLVSRFLLSQLNFELLKDLKLLVDLKFGYVILVLNLDEVLLIFEDQVITVDQLSCARLQLVVEEGFITEDLPIEGNLDGISFLGFDQQRTVIVDLTAGNFKPHVMYCLR